MMILASALKLFEGTRYGEATMAAVAKNAGIAKGTLYLYFPTKETLFLELLGDRLTAWFEELERDLARASALGPVDVPTVLASSLAKRESMCRLLALLHSTLECNVEEDVVHQFKLRLAKQLDRGAGVLHGYLPGMTREEAQGLLMRTQAVTVGLVQMANPVPSVLASYGDPRLAGFKIDFESELRSALRDWLAGWGSARSQAN